MSSDQQRLSAFQTATESPETEDEDTHEEMPEQPQWSPGADVSSMKHSCTCGAHVTRQFYEYYKDSNGKLHGCPSCMTGKEIRQGLPTDPDRDVSKCYDAGSHAVGGGL